MKNRRQLNKFAQSKGIEHVYTNTPESRSDTYTRSRGVALEGNKKKTENHGGREDG